MLISNIDAPLLDINIALWEAEDAGEIKIDQKKDKIKVLKEATPSCDRDLADKIMKVVRHYEKQELNVTVGKLLSWVKNPAMEHNYPYHDYICSLQYLIDTGEVKEEIVSLPKAGDRPFHKFVFLCLDGNPNEEWNSKAINKFIAEFEKSK